jgi:hypothetical protein
MLSPARLALALVPLAFGCSARSAPGGSFLGRDAGVEMDATPDAPSPDDAPAPVDARMTDDAPVPVDAPRDAPVDAPDAPADAPIDAPPDAPIDSPPDTGRDAGPTPMGETCSDAIDVTGGATYSGETCLYRDDFRTSCGGDGAPDVFFQILTVPGGSSYSISVTAGFSVQYVPSGATCMGDGGCGAAGLSIGGGGGIVWWFAVERIDGGCGPFTITFTGA